MNIIQYFLRKQFKEIENRLGELERGPFVGEVMCNMYYSLFPGNYMLPIKKEDKTVTWVKIRGIDIQDRVDGKTKINDYWFNDEHIVWYNKPIEDRKKEIESNYFLNK
jgi:hypothetical protein